LRNLILAFDGTWDLPDNDLTDGDQNTHVARLVRELKNVDSPIEQTVFYQAGVGTHPFDQIRGGLFGWGLSDKIFSGYRWLVDYFQKGDRIYLVGYSRGAFAARSLSGLLDRVGLLSQQHSERIEEAYALYRRGDSRLQNAFSQRYSRRVSIEAVAVWDTVGSLGIPLKSFQGLNHRLWSFHDTRLAKSVKSGFHAIAIDEHRPDFKPTLWSPQRGYDQQYEQRWFAGSHADVGGGNGLTPLSELSYRWICERLSHKGLTLVSTVEASRQLACSHNTSPSDSFATFLGGTYDWFRDRHYRPIGTTPQGRESIDHSVFTLMDRCHYRPANTLGFYLQNTPQIKETLESSVVRLCDVTACQTPEQREILIP